MDETTLVQAAQNGNSDAFRQLFEDNKQMVFTIAYKYVQNREDAEDILQETFIKAYHSLDKFRMGEDTNFTSWLYRIGINSAIDLLRKNRKMKDHSHGPGNFDKISLNEESHDPAHTTSIKDIREKIDYVLNRLTSRQRMIFILRHYQQLSTQEIAEYMDCSQGSIKKQLFRAVTTIKDHFKILLPEGHYEMQKV
jgi:RNA polymerase sigma-70 factor (ECF subfamily)